MALSNVSLETKNWEIQNCFRKLQSLIGFTAENWNDPSSSFGLYLLFSVEKIPQTQNNQLSNRVFLFFCENALEAQNSCLKSRWSLEYKTIQMAPR